MADVILKDVRLSHPDLHKPGAPLATAIDKTPKYGGHFIFVKDSDAYKAVTAEFARVAQEKWGPNWQNIVAAIDKDKKCVRNGNMKLAKDGTVSNGYADMFYVVARNKAKPAVVDSKFDGGKPVALTEESGRPYGGCYVNVKIEIYAMDKPGQGRSINATLKAVQYLRDGEAFAGGPGTPDGFEDEGHDEGEGGAAPAGTENLFG